MTKIAQVVINIPVKTLTKPFSYAIPPEMAYVAAGWRVLVPFGNRLAEGFVVEVGDGDSTNLKYLGGVLEDTPWFDTSMLQLAQWLSERYLCSLAEAMRLFIPGKSGVKVKVAFRINERLDQEVLTRLSSDYRELYLYLAANGPASSEQLHKVLGPQAITIARRLTDRKILVTESFAVKSNKPQYQYSITLAVTKEQAAAAINGMARKPAQQKLLTELVARDCVAMTDLEQLKISRETMKRLQTAGLIKLNRHQVARDSYADHAASAVSLELSPPQQQAVTAVSSCIVNRQFKSFVIHGITGSGKTQVYIEAVAAARSLDRQAIVLVPEIALTSQIVARFKGRFGSDVVVMHSKLSIRERFDACQRLRERTAGIVIGARSALFAPVPDVGVIILDEEHEFTYKQEESPRYHTREVALARGKLSQAPVVLGSATPTVETYYQALTGKHELLKMPARIDGSSLPEVKVVDMRAELAQGHRSVISGQLRQLLVTTVELGQQAIVLLNRRGYSTFVLCRECGFVLTCPHCAVSLVYHASDRKLHCHYCQRSQASPDVCPHCGSRYIRFFGTGTERVEEELASILPTARIIRMDQDTTTRKMAHDRILNDFAAGKYDILLGTQMVAKGHDIKNVTAVGIITADTALNLPDFRAAERTFALLTQASGRAGRGSKPGKVVVQTYNPENYAVQAGAQQDYDAFYQAEIAYRRELSYPPFGNIIKITVQAKSENHAWLRAREIAQTVEYELKNLAATEVIGPFPAPLTKIKDIFRVNLLLKTREPAAVRDRLARLQLPFQEDIIVDVDPLSVM